ncbi:MAG: hypothetical protein RLZZ156_1899 [Deinococcota bacterium]|jgi:hypothetical protein
MSQDPETLPELHIHSPEDLFRYLLEGTILEQVALLEAIATDPESALSFGADQDGRELTDVLLSLEQSNSSLRVATLQALSTLPNEDRIIKAFKERWLNSQQNNVWFVLLEKLRFEGWTELMQATLHQNQNLNQAVFVADTFVGHPDCSAKDRVRIAALTETDFNENISAENTTFWLEQLQHTLVYRAYQKLELQGQNAYELLHLQCDKLDSESQLWLLNWGWQVFEDKTIVQWALTKSTELQKEALELLVEQPAPDLAPDIQAFATDQDPEIRLLAIQAGAKRNWQDWQIEPDQNVQLSMIARLENPQALLELFLHDDWRYRAQAANALIALRGVPQTALEPYLQHQREEVRAAAARVLLEV